MPCKLCILFRRNYTYLPGIGLAIALTWTVADWSAGWMRRRVILAGASLATLGALAICACNQTSYWKDSASLWNRALACTSGNCVALLNMGNVLVKQGKLPGAILRFQEALTVHPGYEDARQNLVKARYNLANSLFQQGQLEQAIAQFQQCLEIQPDNAEARNNLGAALAAALANALAAALANALAGAVYPRCQYAFHSY